MKGQNWSLRTYLLSNIHDTMDIFNFLKWSQFTCLIFLQHMEYLNSGNNWTCWFEILEPKHWFNYTLDETVILFDYVIEILNLPVLSSAREITTVDKLIYQNFISVIFISCNNSGYLIVTWSQSFLKELVSRLLVSIFRNPEVYCGSFGINGSIKITPFTFDSDLCFVNSPGVIGWMKIFSNSSINNRRILLNPSHYCSMRYRKTSLSYYFDKISIR